MEKSEKKEIEVTEIIKTFRQRANERRKLANIAIIFIILLVGTGISLFLFAGKIASNEAAETQKKSIEMRIDELRFEIKRMENELSEAEKSYISEIQGTEGTGKIGDGPAAKLKEQYFENRKKEYEKRKLESGAEIDTLRGKLSELERSNIPLSLNKTETFQLISTIATRISIVILLLFLVKILLPLYRYNIKLSAYFDARADALEIFRLKNIEIDENLLEKLTNNLSPDNVEWGNSPSTPTEQAVDLAKALIERTK